MSEYFANVQAGLALSASWRHPEMLHTKIADSDLFGNAYLTTTFTGALSKPAALITSGTESPGVTPPGTYALT